MCSGGSTPRAVQHRAAAATCLSSSLLVPTSRTSFVSSQSAMLNSGALRSSRISCRSHRSGHKRESLHVSFVPRNNFGTSSSVVPAAAGSDAFDSSFLECESVQSRVSRVSAMLSPAHHTSAEHSSVARGGACGVACCCSCCGLDLVDGANDTCGMCILETHGCDTFNSCVEHGEGQVAKRVNQGAGETKSKRTRAGSGVWRPLEGLMPVGDELATDPRRVSGKVQLGKGCEVVVKIPCVPEKALMVGVFVSPRPGVLLRESWGWKPLLGDSSFPEFVYLGLLVVLFCGLLVGFARLAFCRTGCGGLSLLFWQFCPLGFNCWFWRISGGLDGWGWKELKTLPPPWFDGLARILRFVEDTGVWPDGLLDAYVAMIPKSGGDAIPLGHCVFCLWYIGFGHLRG